MCLISSITSLQNLVAEYTFSYIYIFFLLSFSILITEQKRMNCRVYHYIFKKIYIYIYTTYYINICLYIYMHTVIQKYREKFLFNFMRSLLTFSHIRIYYIIAWKQNWLVLSKHYLYTNIYKCITDYIYLHTV